MKKTNAFLMILLVCLFSIKAVMADDPPPKKWMVGTELDLVPYIFDGYYIQDPRNTRNFTQDWGQFLAKQNHAPDCYSATLHSNQ